MERPPALDDPEAAAFAWARYRRLLGWMALVALAAAGVALAILYLWLGFLPLHMGIAVGAGVFATVLLAAALMGLMFLSSGTGHDEEVQDFSREEVERIWRE